MHRQNTFVVFLFAAGFGLLLWAAFFYAGVQAVHADPSMMCSIGTPKRALTVSIDPDMSAAGVNRADALAAFQKWNGISNNGPLFVEALGDWQSADVLLTAHGSTSTWVDTRCRTGFVQRGSNIAIVHMGIMDAGRNREWLAHELGHTLGFADHIFASSVATNYISPKVCTGAGDAYVGVMSYCTGAQMHFTCSDVIYDDCDLVSDYWRLP